MSYDEKTFKELSQEEIDAWLYDQFDAMGKRAWRAIHGKIPRYSKDNAREKPSADKNTETSKT